MSALKNQLIRLGSENPDLQKHLHPVIARIEKRGQTEEDHETGEDHEKDVRWFEASIPWEGEGTFSHNGFYHREVPFSRVDNISYQHLMAKLSNMATVSRWKEVLEEGPHIDMTGEKSKQGDPGHRPRGYTRGDIHISGKIDASKYYSTLEKGTSESTKEAIEDLVGHVCADIKRTLTTEIECIRSRTDIHLEGS